MALREEKDYLLFNLNATIKAPVWFANCFISQPCICYHNTSHVNKFFCITQTNKLSNYLQDKYNRQPTKISAHTFRSLCINPREWMYSTPSSIFFKIFSPCSQSTDSQASVNSLKAFNNPAICCHCILKTFGSTKAFIVSHISQFISKKMVYVMTSHLNNTC